MRYLQQFTIILFLFAPLLSIAQQVIESAEQMPRFAGCEDSKLTEKEKIDCSNLKLVEFIRSQTKYPKSAQSSKTEGMVIVEFVVDNKGNTTNAKVMRDIGNGCGDEALRVVNAMPRWNAGQDNGQPIHVKMRLPFRFNIPSGKKNSEYSSDGYRIFWGDLRKTTVSLDELTTIGGSTQVVVRDLYGQTFNIDELTLTYERGKKVKVLKNEGKLNDKMKNFINNVREGGKLTVETLIQKDTQFITVRRVYNIES